MVNTPKIKGRMVELGLRQKDIAKRLNLSLPTVSQKLNNIRPMNLEEAKEIAALLKLDSGEFAEFFLIPSCVGKQKEVMT